MDTLKFEHDSWTRRLSNQSSSQEHVATFNQNKCETNIFYVATSRLFNEVLVLLQSRASVLIQHLIQENKPGPSSSAGPPAVSVGVAYFS